jgi:hypothetical protein
MGVITGYTDDTTTTDADKFLTVDSTGATKLTAAATIKSYALSAGSVTKTALATGTTRLGNTRHAGTTLTTAYVTHASVTATSTGKECEAWWGVRIQNAGSGATRTFDVQILCDGVAITPSTQQYTAPMDGGEYPVLSFGFMFSSTPTAGSHTWALQLKASIASAVIVSDNYLNIKEVV